MNSPNNPSKEYVENYDKIIRRIFPCYDEILSLIAKKTPKKTDKALIYGCGTGNEILALDKKNIQIIHGVDSSNLMLEEASKKTNHLKNVSLYLTSNFNVNLNNNYSVVISTLVFHFIKTGEEKNNFIKNLRHFTKIGGLVILTDTFITGNADVDHEIDKKWQEYLEISQNKERITKDFAIFRKSTFPLTLLELEKLAYSVGFTSCHQIFEFFGVKMVMLS
jgi:ubiquinone/menaquinone biosynthesis C-methylase UbiE